MEAMVEAEIFTKVVVYDWQALCSRRTEVSSDSSILLTPIKFLVLTVKYLITELFWALSRVNLLVWGSEMEVYDDYDSQTSPPIKKLRKGQNQEEEDYFNRPKIPVYEDNYFACDMQYDLYILNQSRFIQGNGFRNEMTTNCST